MKTKNLAEKVAVVPSESKGIVAVIAKLMRRRSVIDIVERFQTQHALREEREMGSAVAAPGSTWPARALPSLIQLTNDSKSTNTKEIQITGEKVK